MEYLKVIREFKFIFGETKTGLKGNFSAALFCCRRFFATVDKPHHRYYFWKPLARDQCNIRYLGHHFLLQTSRKSARQNRHNSNKFRLIRLHTNSTRLKSATDTQRLKPGNTPSDASVLMKHKKGQYKKINVGKIFCNR